MKARYYLLVFISFIAIILVMPSVFYYDFVPAGIEYVAEPDITPGPASDLTPEDNLVPLIEHLNEPEFAIVSEPELAHDLEPDPETETNPETEQEPDSEPEDDPIVTITVSAAGDTTLGGCVVAASFNRFMGVFRDNNEDMTYFLRNVRHIFMQDDLTLLNLECALTNETRHRGRKWNYKGEYRMAEILSSSGVDTVSLANNHTDDFFDKGYQDTKDALTEHGVGYFGNETNSIMEINGIKVGLYGFLMYTDMEDRNKVTKAVNDLRDRGAELVIGYFHWGSMYTYHPNESQRRIGHHAIDVGTDLVLGAHPHVIHGIEEYNGKNIVYSLGNFAYGGHQNPPDKDTFIFQQTFTFENGVLQEDNVTNIIPAYISSLRNTNNYQPMIAEGDEAERILKKIEKISSEIGR